jgi:hypothetical protein
MNGLDAIILLLEWRKFVLYAKVVCMDMDYFGIHLDEAKTSTIKRTREINTKFNN